MGQRGPGREKTQVDSREYTARSAALAGRRSQLFGGRDPGVTKTMLRPGKFVFVALGILPLLSILLSPPPPPAVLLFRGSVGVSCSGFARHPLQLSGDAPPPRFSPREEPQDSMREHYSVEFRVGRVVSPLKRGATVAGQSALHRCHALVLQLARAIHFYARYSSTWGEFIKRLRNRCREIDRAEYSVTGAIIPFFASVGRTRLG